MKVQLTTAWLLCVAFSVPQAYGALQCYVCDNCPDPYEGTSSQLLDCPLGDTTTTTQPPSGGDTTILTPPPLPTSDGQTPNPEVPTETPPTPATPVITPPSLPGRRKRQTPNAYRCFRIEHLNTVRRGCASFLGTNTDTCTSINGGVAPTECRICDWDGCNSAAGVRVSLFALLLAVVLSVVLKQ
uniref:Protein sleepless n=1 Tax=Anopheles farauti TaxID=69004 RepID=A0A182QDY9_9DIPT